MEKGYKIKHDTMQCETGVLIVSNYDVFNIVSHWWFSSKKVAGITIYDIGMWKIKKLKHEL